MQAPTSSPSQTPSITEHCDYDRKLLDLGFDAFDQDLTGGWRALSQKAGCEEAAANMVRAYRLNYENLIPLLFWHEAQLRASIGDYASAIPLIRKSKKPKDHDIFGWNDYADATIAFLTNDRNALENARIRLASVARPSGYPAERKWPPNLNVVDGLTACFGKPYKVAYGPVCRKPTQ
ncbi:hypothetical protein EAH84_10350 [Sphingomonas oligophenolica]|uniref:Tetratricopeptide repeat protein n=1 Tax=Sphingomonas oligophenolica TaxID=301154 RepID=A0A502CHU1_9SPHN|nr:hypothetical protein EAH84_10350 [Sphingomonas oligophenolica]